MARKRKVGESYKKYRTELKREAIALKRKLAGSVLWPGSWGTARKVVKPNGVLLVGNGHSVRC